MDKSGGTTSLLKVPIFIGTSAFQILIRSNLFEFDIKIPNLTLMETGEVVHTTFRTGGKIVQNARRTVILERS